MSMNVTATFVTDVPARIPAGMEEDPVSKYLSEIGRRGGYSRAKRLSPEKLKEIAKKAGKASGKARSKKARERRRAR